MSVWIELRIPHILHWLPNQDQRNQSVLQFSHNWEKTDGFMFFPILVAPEVKYKQLCSVFELVSPILLPIEIVDILQNVVVPNSFMMVSPNYIMILFLYFTRPMT